MAQSLARGRVAAVSGRAPRASTRCAELRARIRILDEAGLKKKSCECYRFYKTAVRRLAEGRAWIFGRQTSDFREQRSVEGRPAPSCGNVSRSPALGRTRPARIHARFSASMPDHALALVHDNHQPLPSAAVPDHSHPAHKVDNEKEEQNSSKNAATDIHVTLR
jgi:hypothetical protein